MTTSKYQRVQEAIGQLKDVCFESNWLTAMALINEISMVIVDELCEKVREKETAASPATVNQQTYGEICSDSVCMYCTENACRGVWCGGGAFKGRKLSPC